jgi:hypothetical protein
MTAMSAIPTAKAVKDLLEGLLGRTVEVTGAEPAGTADLATAFVASYVDDSLRLSAVAALDLSLAAYVGAAIGLVPLGGAAACIRDGELSPMLAENVGEVCNVLTTLLNQDGAAHQRLYRVHRPGQQAPADVGRQLVALGARLDLDVRVAGYGAGRLWLSLAAS